MEDKKQTVHQLEPLESVKEIEQAIEAILFAAGYPMRYDKLAEVLSLNIKDVKTTVKEMAKKYNEESLFSGIQLLMYPTSCQLSTKEQYAPYIREALGIRRGGNLSASSMEVLAIVAYNQPVTRSFIDTVRGVDSSYAVTSLLDKGLIEAAGRLDAPGRPMLYVTTDKFLRVFGIHSLDELPETEALSVAEQAQQLTMDVDKAESADTESEDFQAENGASSDDGPFSEEDYTAPVDSEETDVIFENGAGPEADGAMGETSDGSETLASAPSV